MSDHIPIEIITNILERITGVKGLVRWRRVSKEWLALIDSDDFIQRHLQRSSESSSSTTSKLGLFVGSFRHCALYQPGNILRFSHEKCGELLCSCNGLICFWIYSDSRGQILNPATGERRYLDTYTLFPAYRLPEGYGFGYDQSSDDYKLVRFLDGNAEIHYVRARYRRVVKFPLIKVLHQAKGVFACGALHWIDDRKDSPVTVYAFDLGSETVSKLSLPADFDAGYFVSPEVGVMDLCLCVYRLRMGSRFDLWMMKEYGNKDSWVRIYKIDLSFAKVTDYSVSMVGFTRGRILFLLKRSKLVWFDPERNRVEEAMQASHATLTNLSTNNFKSLL
ncbi:F-box protein CPR1 [Linum perenne]